MKILNFKVGAIGTNCYIVYDEKSGEGAVIDPGDQGERIIQVIEEHKIAVKFILLTHGHFDHILAVTAVKEATGAQVVLHEADCYMLGADTMRQYGSMARGYREAAVDMRAKEGTEIAFGGLTARYLHTPGHTRGSSVIQIGDCLFTGDTLFRFECGRCDLEGGDFGQMLQSLARLHDLEGEYQVFPGHESFSVLSEERAHNPYMKQAKGR